MNKKKLTFKLFSILLMVLMFSFVSCDSDDEDEDYLKNEIALMAILNSASQTTTANGSETAQTTTETESETSQTTIPKEITAEDLVGTTWSGTGYGHSSYVYSFHENNEVTETYTYYLTDSEGNEIPQNTTETGTVYYQEKNAQGILYPRRLAFPQKAADGTIHEVSWLWYVEGDCMNIYNPTNPSDNIKVYKNK